MRRLLRSLPLLLILAALAAAWGLGLGRFLSGRALADNLGSLHAAVAAHPVAAPAAFTALYLVVAALAVPEAALLTVAGGALFGPVLGTACTVIGATAGAIVLFLVARGALAGPLRARAAPLLDRLRPGLERDGFFYLLALRLFPLAPFWLANLAPALVGMRLAPFALATLVGIIPASAVFAAIGAGLSEVVAADRPADLSVVLSPGILLPLAGLAALALVPILWRRWRRKLG